MNNRIDPFKLSHQFSKPLLMFDVQGASRQLTDVRMELVVRDEAPGGVSLIFHLAPQIYNEIDKAEEFNLVTALREEVSGPPFNSHREVTIEARLHPQFYPFLSPFIQDLSQIEPFLHDLARQTADHPLLSTSSWFATEVTQTGLRGVSRYRTFWRRLRISSNTFDRIQQGDFQQAIQEFIRGKINLELVQYPQELLDEDVRQFADQISQATAESVREIFMSVEEELSSEGEEDPTDDADEIDWIDPLDAVAAYLNEDGWSWRRQEGEDSLITGVAGENGSFLCQIVWDVANRYLIAYAALPIITDPQHRSAMMEFVTRANYGLLIGAFELDLDNGELRFRNTLYTDLAYPSSQQIAELLYTTASVTDDYLPGILQVNDGIAPQIALSAVEGTSAETVE
ncbi:MAG: YbjN domain-containing protein [Caldilineaceae bacterium]|nr:YbjN domain-containing protein [Caldilineaceae bacterium]